VCTVGEGRAHQESAAGAVAHAERRCADGERGGTGRAGVTEVTENTRIGGIDIRSDAFEDDDEDEEEASTARRASTPI